MSTEIHPTAVVERGAELAAGVTIGPYAHIGPHVVIGEGTRVHARASVVGYTRMGAGNQIHPGAVLGGLPQDLKYGGERTEVVIGDENVFRECVTVNMGTAGGGGRTVIGNRNLIMAYVHIAHDCLLGDRVVLANCAQLAGHVKVEDGVVVSGMAAVHHFSTLGRLSFIGGMSGVRQDVPPFMLVEGNPARPRGLNLVGLKRNEVATEVLQALKKVYRLVYNSDCNRKQALEEVAASEWAGIAEVQELLASFRDSEAGRHGRALEATRSGNGSGGVYGDKAAGRID